MKTFRDLQRLSRRSDELTCFCLATGYRGRDEDVFAAGDCSQLSVTFMTSDL